MLVTNYNEVWTEKVSTGFLGPTLLRVCYAIADYASFKMSTQSSRYLDPYVPAQRRELSFVDAGCVRQSHHSSTISRVEFLFSCPYIKLPFRPFVCINFLKLISFFLVFLLFCFDEEFNKRNWIAKTLCLSSKKGESMKGIGKAMAYSRL